MSILASKSSSFACSSGDLPVMQEPSRHYIDKETRKEREYTQAHIHTSKDLCVVQVLEQLVELLVELERLVPGLVALDLGQSLEERIH